MEKVLYISKKQLTDWSEGGINANIIKRSLSEYKSWQAAHDGRGSFNIDLLPEKQQMKLFPKLKTWESKRKAIINRLTNDQKEAESDTQKLETHQKQQERQHNIALLQELAAGHTDFALADRIMQQTGMDAVRSSGTARLAGWCELEKLRKEKQFDPKAHFASLSGYRHWLLEAMKEEWENGTLPPPKPLKYNPSSLDRKFSDYRKGGWEALLDQRKGNTNRQKRNSLQEKIIKMLYTRHTFDFNTATWKPVSNKKPTADMHGEYEKVYRFYLSQTPKTVRPKLNHRDKCIAETNRKLVGNPDGSLREAYKLEYICTEDRNWCAAGEAIEVETIKLKPFRNYINGAVFRAMNDLFRHGEDYDRNHYGGQVWNDWPEKAHSVWSMDDYTINRHLTINGELTVKRAKAYIVWECATGIPIGFSVGYEANTLEAAKAALYDAACFSGHIAYEIELDGAPFKKGSDEHIWLTTLFKVVRYGTSPNSKYAEQFNDVMEDEYYQGLDGYVQRNMGGQKKEDSKATQEIRGRLAKELGIAPHEYPVISLEDEIHALNRYRDMKCSQRYEKGKLTDREAGKWWQPRKKGENRLAYMKAYAQEKATVATPEALAARFAQLREREEVRHQQVEFVKAGTKYRFDLPTDFLLDHADQLPALKNQWALRIGYLTCSVNGHLPYQEAASDHNGIMPDRAYVFTPNGNFVGTIWAKERTVRSVAEGGNRKLVEDKFQKERKRREEMGEELQSAAEELHMDFVSLDTEELEYLHENAHLYKGDAPDYKEIQTGAAEEIDRRRNNDQGNNAYGSTAQPDYTFIEPEDE